VALVGDGRSNREVAGTRAQRAHGEKIPVPHFEKLGISSRVELVLYAVSHGGTWQAEWVAGGGG
jgi:hypothetical protein